VHRPHPAPPNLNVPCSKHASHPCANLQIDVKLSVAGGKGGEAHHHRDQVAEVTVYTLKDGVVRVEDVESDLYAAIDLVTDKLRRKVLKVKI
jgi:putative sigma-54 modulation protein